MNRDNLLKKFAQVVKSLKEDQLILPFNVRYEGESAADFGGVRNDMLSEFLFQVYSLLLLFNFSHSKNKFKIQMFDPKNGYFEKVNDLTMLPCKHDSDEEEEKKEERLGVYFALGVLLCKSLLEQQACYLPLPRFFFAWLLRKEGSCYLNHLKDIDNAMVQNM